MKALIEPFKEINNTKVGFHPHNNLQMAFANSLEALRCGADMLDCTLSGMGRGAGNLPTEVLLSYLQLSIKDRYNVIPVLNCIDRFFPDLVVDEPWGYQLPYMLSGIFQCHPSYPKTLVELREFSVDEIWNILEIVSKAKPIGFSKDVLNEIIGSGFFGKVSQESFTISEQSEKSQDKKPVEKIVAIKKKTKEHRKFDVSYADRHKDRNFLILANGPTLKSYKEKIEMFIERYDPVILGANNLSGLFIPHYHAFNNKRRFVDYIESVNDNSSLIIGTNIPDQLIKEYTSRKHESLYFIDRLNPEFDIKDGIIQSNCRTVSVLLLGVAIVMGARKIFCRRNGWIFRPDPEWRVPLL